MAIDIGKEINYGVKKDAKTLFHKKQSQRGDKPVRLKEMMFFFSQLSLMLDVGSSLTESLGVIGKQTKNRHFSDVLKGLLDHVEEGRQLSEAMSHYPRTFQPVITNMIHAGEAGGFLKEIIDRVIEIQEKRKALMVQLKTAMTYPAVLFVLGLVVVFFVLLGVLPKFMMFFEGKEHILPPTTRILIGLSRFLKDDWIQCLAGGIGLLVAFRVLLKSDTAGGMIDYLMIVVPPVSIIANKVYTCQLLRTLGHLMESHVPLVDALEITKKTCGNRYYQRFIDRIRTNIEEGGNFSTPFQTNRYILDSVKQMVTVGEESGNLSVVMLRLAKFYDDEVSQELKRASSLIEPLALIVMGGVIGLIVSSVILPMFRLASAIH